MRLIDADKIRYRDMSDGQVNGGVWYTFIEDIQKQPTVDAEPVRHGKWIPWKYHDGFRCEICKEPVYNKYKYCPNCGAKMDGGENGK